MQRVRRQIEAEFENPELLGSLSKERVVAAVLDTGIGRHPDFDGRLFAFRDFVNGKDVIYDDSGHGTHVCGILGGDGHISGGRYRGIAPGCGFAVGKVLDRYGDGSVENMLEGLQWVLDLKHRLPIRVLNISVGIGELRESAKEDAMRSMLEQIWNADIFVVCAAGNKGPSDGSLSSISGGKILSVGCHDGPYFQNVANRCETYSGRGVKGSNYRKPDIVAPGTNIASCNAFWRMGYGRALNAYVTKSGTSMAAPIVAGTAVLAFQAKPQLSNEELRFLLTTTATDLGEDWNKQGWGMVNAKKLLTRLV